MKTTQEAKLNLALAGEYRVLSEILLKGLNATITMGNTKGTDIIVFSNSNKYLRIEVKTSKNGRNFYTGYFPKYTQKSYNDPSIWVLFLPKELNKIDADTFYILTHAEVKDLQLIMNKGNETKKRKGYDNITLKLLREKEVETNRWSIIEECLNEL